MERDPKAMAAMMLGIPGMHVLNVTESADGVHVEVETAAEAAICPSCGAAAEVGGNGVVERRGLPAFGRPVLLSWHLRRWHCTSSSCRSEPWLEEIPPVASSGGVSEG